MLFENLFCSEPPQGPWKLPNSFPPLEKLKLEMLKEIEVLSQLLKQLQTCYSRT